MLRTGILPSSYAFPGEFTRNNLLTIIRNAGPLSNQKETYVLCDDNICSTTKRSDTIAGSRKVVDDSDEHEDEAPVKTPATKTKTKTQPYVLTG